ncbi:hypothetical protein K8640_33440 [Myxococcus sp. XM-1-1-1]|uniref:hypothetical protein n=1 Tax=Myxococcus sp. XM-1-1-1 TaxID=2874602 RepID=UPI001CBC04CA|nr:hypothetical protein [Myxococcus sp. XM-1-1-1]MBZ4413133.1 hypothetical protein [Myxococcus sp. XM-1-1-1]
MEAERQQPLTEEVPAGKRRRWRVDQGLRGMLVVCGVAFLIHLIPLFLPRNMPEQELSIARATPLPEQRVRLLLPLREHPKATAAELREAAELLLDGAPAEAHELALAAERREPEAMETQLLLARVCEVERMERCVRTALERANQLAPMDARPDVFRAELRERGGDTVGASEAMKAAFEKAPGEPLIGLRYARLLSAAQRPSEAFAVLMALRGKVPLARLLVEQALVLRSAGQGAEAVAVLRKATLEDPRLSLAHFELGLALFRLGDVDGAQEALRQADRLDLRSPKALAALCAMQLEARRIDDARLTRMDLERRFSGRMELIRQSCSVP